MCVFNANYPQPSSLTLGRVTQSFWICFAVLQKGQSAGQCPMKRQTEGAVLALRSVCSEIREAKVGSGSPVIAAICSDISNG